MALQASRFTQSAAHSRAESYRLSFWWLCQKWGQVHIDVNILEVNSNVRYHPEGCKVMQDTSGVHVWLVLGKAFRALATRAEKSLNLSGTSLGDSEFRVLEVLLHRGPLPVNTIGPKVWLTPGSISVAVDRLEKKSLVKRKNAEDRRVRLVELTGKGRALITKTFREHAAAMEEAARVLSSEERLMLLRLLKKLGKGRDDES
jgi:MarR family transcriptional regulator, 2-MHQ and catechol-resistance regulon repressor